MSSQRGYILHWVLSCLAACSACAGDEPDTPPGTIEVVATSAQLDNGMRVVAIPNRALPIVSAVVTLRSGAFVEDETQSGYSHLLEHMIFQGNAEVPDSGEFRRRLESLGALSNATTSRDYVRYYLTLPSANLESGLGLLAQSVRAPALDPARLEKEIDVVLAEFDLAETDARDVQVRRVFELLFDTYPNRVSPLGSRDVLEHASADALRELHDTYYIPNNAQLVLSGDVDAQAAIALAQRIFGDWPRGADPFAAHPVARHPDLAADVSEAMTAPVSASHLVVAYQGPNARDDFRASVAADVLAELTSQTNQEFRRLVSPPEVTGAGLRHFVSNHTGVLAVDLAIGPGFERSAISSLASFRDRFGPSITDAQIRTAKATLWERRFLTVDTNLSVAFQTSSAWALAPEGEPPDYVETLYDLTRADIVGVIDHYMQPHHRAAVLLTDPSNKLSNLGALLEHVW